MDNLIKISKLAVELKMSAESLLYYLECKGHVYKPNPNLKVTLEEGEMLRAWVAKGGHRPRKKPLPNHTVSEADYDIKSDVGQITVPAFVGFYRQMSGPLPPRPQIPVKLQKADSEEVFSLCPQDVSFGGQPVALPCALYALQCVADDPDLNEDWLVERDGHIKIDIAEDGDFYGYSQYITLWRDTLQDGGEYDAIVAGIGQCTTLVRVGDLFGIINGTPRHDVGDSIRVRVAEAADNPFQLGRFRNVIPQVKDAAPRGDALSDFLTERERAIISGEDLLTIRQTLEGEPAITRANVSVVQRPLTLLYRPSQQPSLDKFLKAHPGYLATADLWMSVWKDDKSQCLRLCLYNDRVSVEAQVTDGTLQVCRFNGKMTYDNRKALAVRGSLLSFRTTAPTTGDIVHKAGLLLGQYQIVTRILPKLESALYRQRQQEAERYRIMQRFLEFQQQRDQAFSRTHVVEIQPGQGRLTAAAGSGATAMAMPDEVSELFTDTDGEECYVEGTGSDKFFRGYLTQDAAGFRLNFEHSHLDVARLAQEGFELRRRTPRHLQLQQQTLSDFVAGRKSTDIFHRLVGKALRPPELPEQIKYFDRRFEKVEDGNNQPLAIRSAVGNRDILLIQGPPGTGKTSVIVEIIRQLVSRGERLLVCSQAHSAVENIYARLRYADPAMRIGNLDHPDTFQPEDTDDLCHYIANNAELLWQLGRRSAAVPSIKEAALRRYTYPGAERDYAQGHAYVCDQYAHNGECATAQMQDVLKELARGLEELGDGAKDFGDACLYGNLDVVMGTCIGIGMDRGLQNCGTLFDTVIIDEAGKANLAETAVPMQLGRKYILVGDDRQLPPYMDVSEIDDFVQTQADKNQAITPTEAQEAVSTSMFEEFLHNENLPTECRVALNYQYRMHPDIAAYISQLFYDNQLQSGASTERLTCQLEGFPSAVTFIDTTRLGQYGDAFEKGSGAEGVYNPCEVAIFAQRLLPRIITAKNDNPALTVGVITPYRRQKAMLEQVLASTEFEDAVHTVDSIQGGEFDIVVLSLVRAFDTRWGRTVGFLDDMRRLNVALSRAKKKLIILGNIRTLCTPGAHRPSLIDNYTEPVVVFRRLKEVQDLTAEKTSLDHLREALDNGTIPVGHEFENCSWEADSDPGLVHVKINVEGRELTFRMPLSAMMRKYAIPNAPVCLRYTGMDPEGRAQFKYLPVVSIAQLVSDGFIHNTVGTPAGNEPGTGKVWFVFEDDSDLALSRKPDAGWFFNELWNQGVSTPMSLFIGNNCDAALDKTAQDDFMNRHPQYDPVAVTVIDELPKMYVVSCEGMVGRVVKRPGMSLTTGSSYPAQVYSRGQDCITFNISKP